MKKKRDWKSIAGVVAGTLAYLKFAKVPVTIPPTPPVLPDRYTPCPEGFYRKLIEDQWRCWPVYVPPPPPPDCGQFQTPKWDAAAKVWRCVPKGLL